MCALDDFVCFYNGLSADAEKSVAGIICGFGCLGLDRREFAASSALKNWVLSCRVMLFRNYFFSKVY
jgi:hypothetical protein